MPRRKIQDALSGGPPATTPRPLVPDRLVDEIALVGPADRIKDRLQAWKAVAKDGKHRHDGADRRRRVEALRVVAEAVL